MTKTPHQALEDKIESMIDAYGWAHISVGMESEDRPNFTYTIGFQDLFDMPELLIMALSPTSAAPLLHGIATQIKNRDIQIPAKGGRVSQVIKGYDTLFVPVPDDVAKTIALAAVGRTGLKRFRLMQMVWPDTEGRFPGEDGCTAIIAKAQDLSGFHA